MVNSEFPHRLQTLLAKVKVLGQLHETVAVPRGKRDLPTVHSNSRPDTNLLQAFHPLPWRRLQKRGYPRYPWVNCHPSSFLLLLQWAFVEASEGLQSVQMKHVALGREEKGLPVMSRVFSWRKRQRVRGRTVSRLCRSKSRLRLCNLPIEGWSLRSLMSSSESEVRLSASPNWTKQNGANYSLFLLDCKTGEGLETREIQAYLTPHSLSCYHNYRSYHHLILQFLRYLAAGELKFWYIGEGGRTELPESLSGGAERTGEEQLWVCVVSFHWQLRRRPVASRNDCKIWVFITNTHWVLASTQIHTPEQLMYT